jgi:pimeloyl-ACP methyl ester carboxylesterase
MIAYDEATKQPFVATMAGTVLVQLYGTRFLDYLSRSITAPVLLVVGDHDSLFCGGLDGGNCQSPASVLAEERSHYPNAASLSALVARDAGHDVNFHPSAPATYLAIEQWLA